MHVNGVYAICCTFTLFIILGRFHQTRTDLYSWHKVKSHIIMYEIYSHQIGRTKIASGQKKIEYRIRWKK
jgi:hypothetical protein